MDINGGKIYWAGSDHKINTGLHKIQRANLDGTNIEDLVTMAGFDSRPRSVAVDAEGGKIYWTVSS